MEREVFGIFFWSNNGSGSLARVAYGVLCGKNIAVGLQDTQIWIKIVKTTEQEIPINIIVFVLGRRCLNLLFFRLKGLSNPVSIAM